MEKNKENKEIIDKEKVDQLLNHEAVKPKIEEAINKKADEKFNLLQKRNEFLKIAESNPIDSLDTYKIVNDEDYLVLKKSIKDMKNNISQVSVEEIDKVRSNIDYAVSAEQRLRNHWKTIDPTPVAVESVSVGTPESMEDILNNPEAYKDSIVQHHDDGAGNSTKVYKTKLDDEVVDMSILGDRTNQSAVVERDNLIRSYDELLMKNARYKNYQKIL